MKNLWDPEEEQELPRFGLKGHFRLVARILPMAVTTFGGLGLLLVFRVVERPVFGARRPITPWITQAVCATNMVILGIRTRVQGRPMRDKGAMVANHASWLDVFCLNALDRVYFVSKHEVARWFGIGLLARSTGTVFVERRKQAAKTQEALFNQRLSLGHKLLFFPEGTSTDGRRILNFKSTLFAAFFSRENHSSLNVQPVTVIYSAPEGLDDRFFGWWGDADFGPHFAAVLSAPRGGGVEVIFHDPLKVADFPDRKALSARSQEVIHQGFSTRQRIADE